MHVDGAVAHLRADVSLKFTVPYRNYVVGLQLSLMLSGILKPFNSPVMDVRHDLHAAYAAEVGMEPRVGESGSGLSGLRISTRTFITEFNVTPANQRSK